MDEKTPVLIMIQGDEPGVRWKLQETRVTTIGRSPQNLISLVSPTVSRFHCEISYINGLWYIVDLNSKKGTDLNGVRMVQREVLRPGDIIRLSRNVFRFDLIEEKPAEDEALLSLREAGQDREVERKEESVPSLEDIRRRSRLSGADEEPRRVPRYRLVPGLVVVFSVGMVVTFAVGVPLTFAHVRAAGVRAGRAQRASEARESYGRAVKLVEAGSARRLEALMALKESVREYPGAQEAQEMAALYRQVESEWLESEMKLVTGAEVAGNYQDALSHANHLLQNLADVTLRELVEERRHFTERLAHAAYRKASDEAARLLDRGDAEAAIALYGELVHRIGVQELVGAAQAMIQQIKEQYGLAPPEEERPEADGGAEENEERVEVEDELRAPVKPAGEDL